MTSGVQINLVCEALQLLFPDADIALREPQDLVNGHWWIDLFNGPGKSFLIEYRPLNPKPWGAAAIRPDDAWTGPDEVFLEPSAMIAWLVKDLP